MCEVKTCSKCGKKKNLSEFYEGRGDCKECKRTYNRQRYAPIKAATRRRRESAYDGVLKQCKDCGEWKPVSEYYRKPDNWDNLNHKCQIGQTIYAREYMVRNRERHLTASRAWYKRNRKRRLAKDREWRKANPEKSHAIWHRYKARRMAADGDFSKSQWVALRNHYAPDGACPCCGQETSLTIDHVVPLMQGGVNHIENIQPLCQPCNSRKGSRRADDYRPDDGAFARTLMEEMPA